MSETTLERIIEVPGQIMAAGAGADASDSLKAGALSGRYDWTAPGTTTPPGPVPQPSAAVLRLDVDGAFPLATASGEISWGLANRVHWVASLTPDGPGRWRGEIWYKNGSVQLLPQSSVRIEVRPGAPRPLWVAFGDSGTGVLSGTYTLASPYLRQVELEFDATPDAAPVLSIGTHDHPNRPATLPGETLTVQTVFQRAGFDVRTSLGSGLVPLSFASGGASPAWSDAEMHDAMQSYWLRFADQPQWALWVLFAALHEDGESLGGIMFDAGGPRDRQGTAIFTDSFIKNPPPHDAAADAWVKRMCFWTACHEMGHAFNLTHAWQKAAGTPWLALKNEPEARSFMNYPYRVSGGESKFFADFDFRFGQPELLFMRHAPERFVQMGNSSWAQNHGFQRDPAGGGSGLELVLRMNRDAPRLDFMEPGVLELKLTNTTGEPVLVGAKALSSGGMTVVVQREGGDPRTLRPLARYCWKSPKEVLGPGESVYDTLFAAVDRDGWLISEPGRYTVQVVLHVSDEDIVSNPLQLRVAPPCDRDEEVFAQDFFTEDVARVLAFDGSEILGSANATLAEVVDRHPSRPVATHARIALASPLTRDFKMIVASGQYTGARAFAAAGAAIEVRSATPDAAVERFEAALLRDPDGAAASLAHVDYRYYMDRFTTFFEEVGERNRAAQLQRTLHDTLQSRKVPQHVLAPIAERHAALLGGSAPR